MPTTRERLLEEITAMPVVDSHEHLTPERERVEEWELDGLYLLSEYSPLDLEAAGLPDAKAYILDTSIPVEERWRTVKPYYEAVRHTAYVREMHLSTRELFGITELTDQTVHELGERLREANRPGWYRQILRENCNITVAIQNQNDTDVDAELFRPLVHFAKKDRLCDAHTPAMLEALEAEFGGRVRTLADYEELVLRAVHRWKDEGAVGIKLSHAYERTLRYDDPAPHEAEAVLKRALGRPGGVAYADAKPLQDYLVRQAVAEAGRLGLVVAVHTGFQARGNTQVKNADPTLLTGLFMDYPETQFDIFHGGYPFLYEWPVMARYFPNVTVNFCWLHVVSPRAARRLLHECIDTLPATKIVGFGGDYHRVERVVGGLKIARENIAAVLAECVDAGEMGEAEALDYARLILHDNPARIYGLPA